MAIRSARIVFFMGRDMVETVDYSFWMLSVYTFP